MKKKNALWAAAAMIGAVVGTACSDETENPTTGPTPGAATAQYVVAATSGEATYLLTTDELGAGQASIVNAGMEVDNATTWVFYKDKYVYRLQYNQGNAGLSSSYGLDEGGNLQERSIKNEIQNRFTTYGVYGNYVITAASGAMAWRDDTQHPPYGITFTLIDAENQVLTTQTVTSENMVGNGEYCTVSGIVESKGKLYTAVCPEGLSVYGANVDGGRYIVDAGLVNEAGGISGTQHPNSAWVAIYEGTDFEKYKIIRDDRISYATSRYRSQYYQTIDTDSEGNIYVFSSSHAASQSGIQKTDRPSGVVRIPAGGDAFDADYYCDIEALSGGRSMYRVWHVTGDYFLLQMYAEDNDDKSYKANTNRLAIFKADEKKFTWVETGLPAFESIGSFGKVPCMDNGMAYLAVTTVDGRQPAVYVIDPVTATAGKGLAVTCSSIGAVGKLKVNR